MAEPVSTGAAISGALGLKYSTMVAGFLGALVSLSFVSNLGVWGRVSAVLTGTVTAHYVTPVVVFYLAAGQPVGDVVGFLLGLTSMNLIPAVINASRWIRCNVKRILEKRLGITGEEEPNDVR